MGSNGPVTKLHLGCGAHYLEGYINIDRDPSSRADRIMDFTSIGEAFAESSLDEILMVHGLNYLRIWEAEAFFKTALKLLKPGGVLILETPNLEACLERIRTAGDDAAAHLEGVRGLMGFGLDHLAARHPFQPYAMAYSPLSLSRYLQSAGFAEPRVSAPQTHVRWRDMRVEARRPALPDDREFAGRRLLLVCDSRLGHATKTVKGESLLDEYRQQGWQVTFIDAAVVPAAEIGELATNHDFVYLLKVASLPLVRLLKERSPATVVFDLADALWMPVHRAAGWSDLEAILATVDGVFYENEFVGEFGRRFNARCFHVPVISNVEKFTARSGCGKPVDRVVIGWVGSPGTAGGLIAILPEVLSLLERYPRLEFVLLGTGDRLRGVDFRGMPVRIVETYSDDQMIDAITEMHIGLFPLASDLEDFVMRGAQKAILYMQGGAVPVTIQAGECAKLITERETGMFVHAPGEWRTQIGWLLEHPEAMREIGARAARLASVGRTKKEIVATTIRSFAAVRGLEG